MLNKNMLNMLKMLNMISILFLIIMFYVFKKTVFISSVNTAYKYLFSKSSIYLVLIVIDNSSKVSLYSWVLQQILIFYRYQDHLK